MVSAYSRQGRRKSKQGRRVLSRAQIHHPSIPSQCPLRIGRPPSGGAFSSTLSCVGSEVLPCECEICVVKLQTEDLIDVRGETGKSDGFTPRFVQLDKKVLRYSAVLEEILDPAVVGSAPIGAALYEINHVVR
jgi:hypothetical protein